MDSFDNIRMITGSNAQPLFLLHDVKSILDGERVEVDVDECQTIDGCIYLTYLGMLRVLFASRSKNAHSFRKWATERLFTIQMGTQEQREQLSSDVLGINVKNLNAFLNTSASAMPCIYLFCLGTVKALRSALRIPAEHNDCDLVMKYGFTKDLKRRTSEHERTLGKLKGADMSLVCHVYVDPINLSEAEADVKDFFTDMDWDMTHEKHEELVVVPEYARKTVLIKYREVGISFGGKLHDLQVQLETERKHSAALGQTVQRLEATIEEMKLDRDSYRREFDAARAEHKQIVEDMRAEKREQRELYEQLIAAKEDALKAYRRCVK